MPVVLREKNFHEGNEKNRGSRGPTASLRRRMGRKGHKLRLFSAHATKVEVCLFDENGERELERIALPEYTDQIWHGYLPEI